jgi:CRISPR/Cas system-associated exonuclease Cas4 (RecB family)
LFDYKSGRAPENKLTIQIPLYAFCLSELFSATAAEAAYLSLREKRAVPRQDWPRAKTRLRESFKQITEGRFPPRPFQEHLCNSCGYAGLCRKEIDEKTPAEQSGAV